MLYVCMYDQQNWRELKAFIRKVSVFCSAFNACSLFFFFCHLAPYYHKLLRVIRSNDQQQRNNELTSVTRVIVTSNYRYKIETSLSLFSEIDVSLANSFRSMTPFEFFLFFFFNYISRNQPIFLFDQRAIETCR